MARGVDREAKALASSQRVTDHRLEEQTRPETRKQRRDVGRSESYCGGRKETGELGRRVSR